MSQGLASAEDESRDWYGPHTTSICKHFMRQSDVVAGKNKKTKKKKQREGSKKKRKKQTK